jgi:acyl carrier protein
LREQRVFLIVKETICRVFQLDTRPEELGDRDRLSDLGMDSLIALELRSELSKGLGLEGKISSTIAFDTGTVGELARSLVGLLTPRTEHSSRPADAQPVASRRKEQAQITAEQLESMSDEEVEQLLKARLSKQ